MQGRTLSKNKTLAPLLKKLTIKNNFKKIQLKQQQDKQNEIPFLEKSIFHKHHASKYIRGTFPNALQYKKFVTLLYKGIFYSINNLKGPSQQYINKKKVQLPDPIDNKKKFLIMDLDQTLIHSVFTSEKTDVKFNYKKDQFKFNIRPYCFQFLQKMNEYYSIYVFTAGTLDYAQPIINYLNEKKKTIQGLLHRKNCMQTQNGFYIKDLRIIKNKQLKDIIMVDNLVHSFGLQLTNGIPILQFLDNKQDKQLCGLQKTLIYLHDKEDVRDYLQQQLKLKQIIQFSQAQYTIIEQLQQKI